MAILFVIFVPSENAEQVKCFDVPDGGLKPIDRDVDHLLPLDDIPEDSDSDKQEISNGETSSSGASKERPANLIIKEDVEEKKVDDEPHATTTSTGRLASNDTKSISKPNVIKHTEKPNVPEKGNDFVEEEVNDEADDTEMISFFDNLPLHLVLKHMLEKCGITNYSCVLCENESMYQVQFLEPDDVNAEKLLIKLTKIGLGKSEGSTISMFPASVHMFIEETPQGKTDNGQFPDTECKDNKISEFKNSIKARLTVAQVVESVKSNATLSFDFVMLIILASCIAAIGLVENNSVVLVASMLISPLMGPILAGTFGTVVHNYSLRNLGLRSEIIGLAICVSVGFLFGLLTGAFGLNGALWGSADEYPTAEMKSRGVLRSLWIGVLIALPSGAGVALSVLGGNAGSLVGVAISASLLPPAVNSGMLWAYALLTLIHPPTVDLDVALVNNSSDKGLHCQPLLENSYSFVYSCEMAKEAGVLGSVSLVLTLLNIGCIVLMAVIVLKIKEVAPNVTSSDLKKEFWQRDIKIARDSYKTYRKPESNGLGKRFLDEWKALQKSEGQSSDETEAKNAFHDILEDLEHDHTYQGVVQSIPSSPNPQIFERQISHEVGLPENELKNPAYHTIHFVPTSDSNHVLAMEIFHPLLKHSNKSRGYHEYQRQKSHLTLGSSWNDDSYQPKTRRMSYLKNFLQKNEQPKVRFTVTKVNEKRESVPEESGKRMAAQSSAPAKSRRLFRKFNAKPKKKFLVTRVNEKRELKTLV